MATPQIPVGHVVGETAPSGGRPCSLGKDMNGVLRNLLYGLKLLYEDENHGAEFPLEQWRCPQGRGIRRSESQAFNGLNCGVFAAYKVECLAKRNKSHYRCGMTNELAPLFRKYMIDGIREVVDQDPDLIVKELSPNRKRKRQSNDKLDGDVIDLTQS